MVATPADRPPVAERRAARHVLSGDDVGRVVNRIAHQILEKTDGGADTVLLGIPTRGVPLAQRLAAKARAFEGAELPVGSLDPTMYRDDLRLRGVRPLGVTALPPTGVDGKVVILVDDVLFSGRTVRAALDALSDLGRPRAVQLAVLVDRGHRELPIRADYVGKNMPTSRQETVRVLLTETDGVDAVVIGPADAARRPSPAAAGPGAPARPGAAAGPEAPAGGGAAARAGSRSRSGAGGTAGTAATAGTTAGSQKAQPPDRAVP